MCEIALIYHCLSTVSHIMCPASRYVGQHPRDVLLIAQMSAQSLQGGWRGGAGREEGEER
jgi:hypothetical protein